MLNKKNICILLALVCTTVQSVVAMRSDSMLLNMPVEVLSGIVFPSCDVDKSDYDKVDIVRQIQTFFRLKQVCKDVYEYFKFPWITWDTQKKNNVLQRCVDSFEGYWKSGYTEHRIIPLALVYSGANDFAKFFFCAIGQENTFDVKWLFDHQQKNNPEKLIEFEPYYCRATSKIASLLCNGMEVTDELDLFDESIRRKLRSEDYTGEEKKSLMVDSIRKHCVNKTSFCNYHDFRIAYYAGFYEGWIMVHKSKK